MGRRPGMNAILENETVLLPPRREHGVVLLRRTIDRLLRERELQDGSGQREGSE
jgi:hypothetical protein